jgi:hypothetical protein
MALNADAKVISAMPEAVDSKEAGAATKRLYKLTKRSRP